MKKKIVAPLMILSILSMLTACGSTETTTDSGSQAQSKTPRSSVVESSTANTEPMSAPQDSVEEELSPLTLAASLDETNAEDWGTCGDNLTWYYANNILVIRGIGEMNDSPWRDKYQSDIKWVIIEDGCKILGKNAFYGCSSLTNVIIPDSVTTIDYSAFEDCTSLTSITIPDGVTYIGEYAFSNCTSLTSIAIPNGVTEIFVGTFEDCTSLTNITIPNSVTIIGDDPYQPVGAFKNCTSLTSITIPDSVTAIGGYAFSGCTNLENITIPGSVTTIGRCAFYECTSLTNITISDGVITIGRGAFMDCISLTNAIIPASVEDIYGSAFMYTSLTEVVIPNSDTRIGEAFDPGTKVIIGDTEIIWEKTSRWKVR